MNLHFHLFFFLSFSWCVKLAEPAWLTCSPHSQNCPQASNPHKQCGLRLNLLNFLVGSKSSLGPFYFSIERFPCCAPLFIICFLEKAFFYWNIKKKLKSFEILIATWVKLQSASISYSFNNNGSLFSQIKCKTFDKDLTTCSPCICILTLK